MTLSAWLMPTTATQIGLPPPSRNCATWSPRPHTSAPVLDIQHAVSAVQHRVTIPLRAIDRDQILVKMDGNEITLIRCSMPVDLSFKKPSGFREQAEFRLNVGWRQSTCTSAVIAPTVRTCRAVFSNRFSAFRT
jgi:hypothetical protein